MSYYQEAFAPITIDGVEYEHGELTGVKIVTKNMPNRYFIVATVSSSNVTSVWSRYISTEKIIMRKVMDDYDSGWYSDFPNKYYIITGETVSKETNSMFTLPEGLLPSNCHVVSATWHNTETNRFYNCTDAVWFHNDVRGGGRLQGQDVASMPYKIVLEKLPV